MRCLARRLVPALVLAAVMMLLGAAQQAFGAQSAAQQLADKYAPIVNVVKQAAPCDPNGEPYGPSSVNPILGNSAFAFAYKGTVKSKGPTAATLWRKPDGWAIDYPGNPLSPGCTYDQLARDLGMGVPPKYPTAYAHVTTQKGKPGQLVVQYWFFYLFNDYNNKHEGDWEMAQLVFKADTPEQALKTTPSAVGLSQHNLGESGAWTDPKVQKQGDHPVVYPGRGSHANFFGPGVWLERSASEGVGCDDTRAPHVTIPTQAVLLPNGDPGQSAPLAWIAYQGEWGAALPPPDDGPPGPNTTDRWTNPITWQEQTRTSSTAIPQLGFAVTTTAFCWIVGTGSNLLLDFSNNPIPTITVIIVTLLVLLFLATRTHWGRVPLEPLVRERPAGSMIRSSLSLIRRSPLQTLFTGVVFIPIFAITAGISWVFVHLPVVGDILNTISQEDGVFLGAGAISAAVPGGIVGFLVAIYLVSIGMADRNRDGRNPTLRQVGREAWQRLGGTARSVGLRALQVVVLLVTIIGIPWAIWILINSQVLTQVCAIEGRTGRDSRERATSLVRGARWRTVAVTILASLIPLVLAPMLAMPFLLLGLPVWTINVIGTLFAAIFTPLAAVVMVFLYGDLVAAKATQATRLTDRAAAAPADGPAAG